MLAYQLLEEVVEQAELGEYTAQLRDEDGLNRIHHRGRLRHSCVGPSGVFILG
jgi:hypothetical protein